MSTRGTTSSKTDHNEAATPNRVGSCHAAACLAANCQSLIRLLEAVSAEQYQTTTPFGSIGPHIRHCLDHLAALRASCHPAGGDEILLIDYEQRRRGWAGETNKNLALAELSTLISFLRSTSLDTDQSVIVRHIVDPDRPAAEDHSTLGRELHFCLSHSVHHQAIIAFIVKHLGMNLPDDFGYAPSTLASLKTNQKQPPAAPSA